jgi:hypothetical protein
VAALKNIFQPASGAPSVSSLSFEFCAATVNRSWCEPNVFSARFWRFADPTELLSDGATPPQGECPAYITGIVFARNIVVTDAPAGGVTPPPRPLPIFPPILLRRPVIPIDPVMPVNPVVVPVRPVNPVVVPVRPVNPVVVPVRPVPEPILEQRPEPLAETVVARPAAQPAVSPVTVNRLNNGTFNMIPIDPVLSPPAPSGGNPSPAPGQPPSGDVSILAFICTQLPRCPNADPTLTW